MPRSRRTRTVRLRVTALYSTLFLVTGAVLVGFVYVLAAHAPLPGIPGPPDAPPAPPTSPGSVGDGGVLGPPPPEPPPALPPTGGPGAGQRPIDVQRLLISSVLALAVMGAVSVVLGWLMAGRVLHPLAAMTATVRRISADELHRRLAATGPDDELKELADTFDGLLDRLERAFDAQRRFVADASHELRTPLTLQRTTIEVALCDAGATTESLRDTLRRLLASGEHQARIIEALLTLARSQQDLARRHEVDLATVTGVVLAAAPPPTDSPSSGPDAGRAPSSHSIATLVAADEGIGAAVRAAGIRISSALAPAPVQGDRELLSRLVVNLLSNAVRHNVPGGWVHVSTSSHPDQVLLSVANSGPVVPPDQADRLLEPFRRLGPARVGDGGLGLGLSIVAAIARAHRGEVVLHARPEGGLDVRVTLPAATARPFR